MIYSFSLKPAFAPSSKACDNVTVVIRSAGERTVAACHSLVANQIDDSHIVVIQERPFENALRRCYEVGIERGRKWTLAIDADVLLRANAIPQLLELAEGCKRTTFEVQAPVVCKLFGGTRLAGVRLYRTRLLKSGLRFIPPIGREQRPEYYVVRQMALSGYSWREFNEVVGLHDFEQAYNDIFRKAYAFAKKSQECIDALKSYWSRLASVDRDFEVALAGLSLGTNDTRSLKLDAKFLMADFARIAKEKGWTTKPGLGVVDEKWVEELTINTTPAPEFLKIKDLLISPKLHSPTLAEVCRKRLRAAVSRLIKG